MNEEKQSDALEDNVPMATYIMLHRIYDLLTLISNKVVGGEDTQKMVDYHEAGYLFGPSPSYTVKDENE